MNINCPALQQVQVNSHVAVFCAALKKEIDVNNPPCIERGNTLGCPIKFMSEEEWARREGNGPRTYYTQNGQHGVKTGPNPWQNEEMKAAGVKNEQTMRDFMNG